MPSPNSPHEGTNSPPPTNALQELWNELLRTGFMDGEKPTPPEAGPANVTVNFHRPPPPPEDPAVAALTGPYWDGLRKLKRVRITCPPASGIVLSRQTGTDPHPPAPTPGGHPAVLPAGSPEEPGDRQGSR
jgi:hypothetical protein